jgi:hypothetical protein
VDRAHIDDAAAAAGLVHFPQRGARREKCAIQMDSQELLPFRKLELFDRRHDLNAGIGNKDIEPAEGLDRFGAQASVCASLVTSTAKPMRVWRHRARPQRHRPPSD